MKYKCQYCSSELKSSESHKWTYSCPNTHIHIRLDKKGIIDAYRLYIKINGITKYSIEQTSLSYGPKILRYFEQSRVPEYTPHGRLIGTKRKSKLILRLEKFFPIKVSADGTLLADVLHNKLKMYMVFS